MFLGLDWTGAGMLMGHGFLGMELDLLFGDTEAHGRWSLALFSLDWCCRL